MVFGAIAYGCPRQLPSLSLASFRPTSTGNQPARPAIERIPTRSPSCSRRFLSGIVISHRICTRSAGTHLLRNRAEFPTVRPRELSVAILRLHRMTGAPSAARERLSRIALLPRHATKPCMARPSPSALLPSPQQRRHLPRASSRTSASCSTSSSQPLCLWSLGHSGTDRGLHFRHPLPQPPRLTGSGDPVTCQFTLALLVPSIPQRFSLDATQSHAFRRPLTGSCLMCLAAAQSSPICFASEPHPRRHRGSVPDRTCFPR
jgi:hypothetical protein